MPARSPATFEARASFALGAASLGAQVVAGTCGWAMRAFAGEDVVGFCRTSLASISLMVFVLLRFLLLVGVVGVPLLVLLGLARGGLRRSLLPGFLSAILLLLYLAGLRANVLPQAARHPCLRSDASDSQPGGALRMAAIPPRSSAAPSQTLSGHATLA
jgi:hypothetical protein